MPSSALQGRPVLRRWRALAAVGLIALGTSGCLSRRGPEATGSINPAATASPEALQRDAETWSKRFDANPTDPTTAIGYAAVLRAQGQRAQAVAVLQQAAIRQPKSMELMGAYGRALSDVGRFKEAADVLARAHLPERPDWRILSAQGAVADQLGEHARAQSFYEGALRIVPGEPAVLSNLGLSYALSKRLPDAERALREAAAHPQADARVRQNLALVLGLQGKLGEAEELLRRTLPAQEAESSVGALRAMVAQPNSWNAIRNADGARGKPARPAPKTASAKP
ncbi:tetratricopeptide repeat protein [Salinarimonas soli]|uniref:Tetratricopeptide repeat protein n=1 Tax=Salinarimonas soli TaxID=1638099 RepID=A0A5B2V9D9_9HYPH|nr:tetratricopeptide repeat protein [Salinarimonas soli]KAA2235002.1 tetratricopeptide repeat protein [Salinarimonas soli]